jgi:uncharacterized membrane protein
MSLATIHPRQSVRSPPVSTFQWLIAVHITGAFFVLGGSVAAGAFGVLALRSRRPSEIALFLGLARLAVPFVIAGAVITLVFGLWLVHCQHLSYGRFWIVASIILLVASSIAGQRGGKRDAGTRRLAVELAAGGDTENEDLRPRLRDPATLALTWGAGAAVVAILVLMIWKPGA